MNLYLARHGETQANVDGVYCGSSDLPLIPQGRFQAHHIAWQLAAIPFQQVLTSTLTRARETAGIVCPHIPLEPSADWDEMHFGAWELRHHRDLRAQDAERYAAWCSDWRQVTPPGGEGFQTFAERVSRAAGRLEKEARHDTILLVAHQGVLAVLLATLLRLPPAALWHFSFRHDAYTRLELRQGFCVIKRLNDSGRAVPDGC